MRTRIFYLQLVAALTLASSCSHIRPAELNSDEKAAYALCERILGPEVSGKFIFRTIPDSTDVFLLSSKGSNIVVEGNNANSMATGLNYYLKYKCNVSLGFYKPEKIDLPAIWPKIAEPIRIEAACRDRFFLNYCTFGYSMPWWGWEEWEYFIDWMALNGINLPLSITGQEAIWFRVWTEMGMDPEYVLSYFTGPSHLPWHRMSNIDEWGGPLPMSWLNGQEELQKQIVARERELNMKPVLPAFSGHVPEKLAEMYPDSKIDKLSLWGGFSEEEICFFLDPTDPLYKQIQKNFIEKQTELFGTDHIYGLDLFNEVTPPSWEPEYLAEVGNHVYSTLSAADPDATWLQMAWLFYFDRNSWTDERVRAYVTSYPADKSILLDYFCEYMEVWQMRQKFSGVPFIWCYLGNFGGNTHLVGNLPLVKERIDNTFASCDNVTGIGSTLEGLDCCNELMYDYIFERAWDFPEAKDLDTFIAGVADRRCGLASEKAREAWKILLESVYSDGFAQSGHCTMVNVRPYLTKKRSNFAITEHPYSNDDLLRAIKLLLEVDSTLDAYEFDLVNLTREWLGNRFGELFKDYVAVCKSGDADNAELISTRMLEIISDLDKILSCRDEFSLGKWIADARKWGVDEAEKLYFEKNARNIVTTWGRPGISLNDYANRSLAGLVSSFYGARWQMFFNDVQDALKSKGCFTEEDEKAFTEKVKAFEGEWWDNCIDSFNAASSKDDAKSLVLKAVKEWE